MINSENKYKKLAFNSFLFALGSFGSKLITFIMLPLYTVALSQSEYGISDLVLTSTSLLLPVISLSIYESMLRFGMDSKYESKKILSNSVFVTSISSIILITSVPIVFLLDIKYGYFVLFLLILQSFQSLLSQYAKATDKIRIFALNGILLSLLTAVLNIVFLVVLKMGIIGYLVSLILAYLFSNLWLIIMLHITNDLSRKDIDFRLIKEMLNYSIPLIPNSIAFWINNTANRYFILFFLGSTMNGIFAIANKIPSLLSILNSIFFQSWQMSAIEEYDSKDKSKFYTDVFNVYSKFLFFGTSFILVFLKLIVQVAVSDNFYEAWKYVPFLLLTVVYSSFSSFLGTNYIAAKKTRGVFFTTIIGAVINLVLNLILIPIIRLNGAGISSMISFLSIFIIRLVDTRKFIKLEVNLISFALNHFIIFVQIYVLYLFEDNVLVFYGVEFFILLFSILVNKTIFLGIFRKFRRA